MFGYLLHKYNKLDDFIVTKQIMFLSFVFYVTLMVIVLYFDKYKILGLFIPLFASSFLYCFTKKENELVSLRMVKLIGKYSMEIYVFHLFFIIQIPEIGQYILTLTNFSTSITLQLVYSLIITVISVFFSISIAKIINSNQYLSKLLFGK